ncbi:MAG: trigger factor [Oscillatoriales cyanobacterium SM2_1_8]|nr:trigger factor [Oscillatoriales cyanobacterium SM2_1_8]
MKVSHETLPGSKVRFDIEVEGERSQKIHDATLQRLLKTIQVPGFRKGKAPRQLLMQYVGGETVRAEVFEKLIEEVLREVRTQHETLKPLGQFRLGQEGDDLFAGFRVGEILTFAAEIDVEPTVEVADYVGMTVTVEPVQPDPEAPGRMLAEFQRRRAPLVPVEGRPAASGDVVTIDYVLRQPDGQPVADWEDETGVQLDLLPESFLPEIVAGIEGMNPGEIKEIPAHLTDSEDGTAEPEPVVATVTLQSIKVRELPSLDDDFARSISQKETMAELQAYLDEREANAAAEETEERIQTAIVNALVERTHCEVPQTLLQQELEFLLQRNCRNFRSQWGKK